MKGQQLFHSFLPGVTVAVLTTQPAWAETVQINSLQINATPNVLTATSGSKLINNKPEKLILISDRSESTQGIAGGANLVRTKPILIRGFQTQVTGKTNFPVKKTLKRENTKVSKLTSKLLFLQHLLANDLAQSNTKLGLSLLEQEKPQNLVLSQAKSVSLVRHRQRLLSQRLKTHKLSSSVRLKAALKKTNKSTGIQKVVEFNSCTESGSDKNNFPVALVKDVHRCANPVKSSHLKQKLAQEESVEINTVEQPAVIKTTPVPNYLNPNPNPLQFPTKPEEVRVKGTQPITLEQALELARRNNRDLEVALLQLQRFTGGLREAKALLYPNIGVQTQVNGQQSSRSQLSDEVQSRAEEGLSPQLRSPSRDPVNTNFTAQVQMTYNIYTSGRRSSIIKIAEERVKSSQLDVERISEEIRLSVATEYYNLQQREEEVRIAESAVKNAEASLKDAQALEEAGVGTRFDVLRSQVNLANAQQDLTSAISNQKIARSTLVNRLSLPLTVAISAADQVKLAGLWNSSLEESIVKAFANRPELQQNLIQRNISKQERRQALSALRPQISLVANYDLLDQFEDRIGVTDGYSIGLRATMILFDGGAAKAQAFQAKTNMAFAETQFAQQRNQIRFEVEQAYSNLKSSLDNVQTANAALDQAKEALRLARLRFQAGVGTQTDVIAAESDLTRSEGNRVRAILDYNRSLANLQRFVTSRASR